MICENSCLTDDKLKINLLDRSRFRTKILDNTHNMRKDQTHKTETFYRRKHQKCWDLEANRSNKVNTDYLRYMEKCMNMSFDKTDFL